MPENRRKLYDLLNVASLKDFQVRSARRRSLNLDKNFAITNHGQVNIFNP
jgi:hypothetical protein